MAVFVDDMHKYPMGRLGRMKMSHLIADTENELHAMAARIGVARRWFQGDHYDICLAMRAKAVAAGAVEITLRQCSAMAMHRRRTGMLPRPDEAIKKARESRKRLRSSSIAE